MSWRAGIHGYAARWNVVTAPLSRPNAPHLSRPARFERGCFAYDLANVGIWFMHRQVQSYGLGASLGLEIWEDEQGLAFAFRPPATAYSLVCGVADGRFAACSVGFTIADSREEQYGGETIDGIRLAGLTEISICPSGACPGAVCWHAANEPHAISPIAAAALPIWREGRRDRQRHVSRDRIGGEYRPGLSMPP